MELPDWFVIIREWVAQDWGKFGVTLPFLVGAIAYKQNKPYPTTEDARSLLNEMIAAPIDKYVTEISWCSELGAPVIRATPVDSPELLTSKVGIKHPSEERLCLVFGEGLAHRWESSDSHSLMESLISDAEEAIRTRKYSRNLKAYDEFASGELSFIKKTIMSSS